MNAGTSPARAEDFDAARLLLARMGLTAQQLVEAAPAAASGPTFEVYIPQVANAVSAGTRRVYGTYWNRIVECWGERRLDEPSPSEIHQLAEHVRERVVLRRNARGGRGAAEHLIAALRCIYRHAVLDGLIRESDNPALKVAKPRRLPSTRSAVPDHRLDEINRVGASTGNDPELDSLILRLHSESAARRGGALALRPRDLDEDQCLILLREKGDTFRWQPVSPTLMTYLLRHARARDAPENGQLLRYGSGAPITTRRYDHLWSRIGQHLPWVAAQGISTHWLRHTTITWVERSFGYAVARAFAGHIEQAYGEGSTAMYVRAGLHEVAQAVEALTGEAHPLVSAT